MTLAGVGAWVPERRLTAEALAMPGADAAFLRGTVGLEARHAPEGDVSPYQLVEAAAQRALDDAGVAPGELDLVLTVGRSRAEYLGWSLGLALKKHLGAAPPAVGVDLCDSTGGTLLTGLRVAAAKFAADPRRNVALVAVQQRLGDMVDTTQPGDRFLWPLGDGGAAVVVRRGEGPRVLASAFAHEGRAGRDLRTRMEIVDEGPTPGDFFQHEWAQARFLTLRDERRWWADHQARAMRRLPQVLEEAARRGGVRLDEVARVQAGFLPPAIAEGVREQLGLGRRFQAHNAHGQLNGAELGFPLRDLLRDASLRGKPVMLLSAGFPSSFGAMLLRL